MGGLFEKAEEDSWTERKQVSSQIPSYLLPCLKFEVVLYSLSKLNQTVVQHFLKLVWLSIAADPLRSRKCYESDSFEKVSLFLSRAAANIIPSDDATPTELYYKKYDDIRVRNTHLVAPDYPLEKWQVERLRREMQEDGTNLDEAEKKESKLQKRTLTSEVYTTFYTSEVYASELAEKRGAKSKRRPHCAIMIYDASPILSTWQRETEEVRRERFKVEEKLRGYVSVPVQLEEFVKNDSTTPIVVIGLITSVAKSEKLSFEFPFYRDSSRQVHWTNEVLPKYGHRLLIPRPIEIAIGDGVKMVDSQASSRLLYQWSEPNLIALCSEPQLFHSNLHRCYFLTFAMYSFCDQGQGGALYLPKDIVMCILALCCVSEEKFSMHNFVLYLTDRMLKARIRETV